VRLLLSGQSVIDWHKVDFRDPGEVDRFLRVNEFDPSSTAEMRRLSELRDEAVDYLHSTFNFHIPDDVVDGVPTRDLFLIASRQGPHQRWACVVLKVMHIIHHLAGRELAVRLPISADAVYRTIELKVMQVVEELRAAGHPVTEFQWSRKPRDSLITKLLAKRDTVAARVYDRLRFRLIVRNRADLMPMVAVLARQLVPFNYVIPGESINNLLPLDDEIRANDSLRMLAQKADPNPEGHASAMNLEERRNEFSGPSYRVINFVADLPVRIDRILPPEEVPQGIGHVVFVLTEFQLCDESTSAENEDGDNSHESYKNRQRKSVRNRLLTGWANHSD
jgi:uncharacterized protein (TIGR04552 family)